MAENTNQMTACSDKKQCFNVNHPLSLTVSTPNQKKKTSFQITSVTIGSRLSNDGGDDSADDLDESHTEDISDIVDISRITDIENETPSFSEDTFSKDDVFFNSSTSLGSAPVIPTSSQYGLAIVATPDGINNTLPSAIGNNNNASGELRVSVTDNVINLGVLNGKHTDSDMRDIHTHSTRNERFKVVKIESTEPFKRGRWMCMDYLDHSMLQTNQSHPIISNVPKVPETNEISHSNQCVSNEVINPPSEPAAVVCVPEDKMSTTFDQSGVVGGAVSLPVDQHQPLTSQNNPTVAIAQTLPAAFTNISPGQTMTLQSASQMTPTMHAQSMSQVPIQQNMLNANQQHQSLQHQQMQQLLANSNNIAGMQQFQQPSLMQQQTHLVQQHNMPVHPMPMQTIHSNQQMQPPPSQFPVHQQIQLQQQHLQHQQICQPGVASQMNTQQQVNAHSQILHSQQAFPSNSQMAPTNTMHPSAVTNQPQQHMPQQPQYYIQNPVPVITSQGSLQTTQTAHQGGLHQQNYAATSMPQQQMVNQAAMHPSYQTAANVSPQLQPQLTSNIQQQCYVSHPVATSNSNIVQQTYVSSANSSVPCSMIETPSSTIPSSGDSIQSVDHVHTTTVLLDSLADSTAVLPQSAEEVKAGDEAEGASGTSGVAIDNKIEQAMDLVKSHLMFAVREEVEVLKEKIAELMDRINQLEVENAFLKANASPETLAQLASCAMPPPAASLLP